MPVPFRYLGRSLPYGRRLAVWAALTCCLVLAATAVQAKQRGGGEVQDGRGAALAAAWRDAPEADLDRTVVTALAGLGGRVTGTEGCAVAADAVEAFFKDLGQGEVGRLRYRLPVMRHGPASLSVTGGGQVPLSPLALDAFTPGSVPPDGLAGPVVYAGGGDYRDFDGKLPAGAIVLMDLHSRRRWQNAAQLDAKALIYIDEADGGVPADRGLFTDKFELTPVRFPRFLLGARQARELLGEYKGLTGDAGGVVATLHATAAWEPALASDVYLFLPGTDPALAGELLVVEAPYDSAAFTPGQAPGADEAASIAALIRLAKTLVATPPARPTLLVATSGHAASLAGVREFYAALRAKGKDLRHDVRERKAEIERIEATLAGLDRLDKEGGGTSASLADTLLRGALFESLKDEIDAVATSSPSTS